MSAADRTVVRTRDGRYRVVPRRIAAGLISTGRARLASRRRVTTATRIDTEPVTVTFVERSKPPVPLPDAPEDLERAAVVRMPAPPKTYANKRLWVEYAHRIGVTVDESMTKAAIQAAVRDSADDTARLPQPAREGGRLETPEDEPVPEAGTDDTGPV